jgi:predicted PurR-regulated permease PerM
VDKINRNLIKSAFIFVILAYIGIKCIDQYEILFRYFKEFLAVLLPFILGTIFAYAVNPMVNYFEKLLKGRRGLSILCAYLIVFFVMGLGIRCLIPVICENIVDLVNQIPGYVVRLQTFYTTYIEQLGTQLAFAENLKNLSLKLLPYLGSLLNTSMNMIIDLATNTIGLIFNIFIGLFISYYLLIDKEKFCTYIVRLIYIVFRQKGGDRLLEIGKNLNINVGKYLVGKGIDSIFVGICATVGIFLVGGQYAVLLGVIFGITNMIPYIGPIVGTVIAVGINLFNSPAIALIILAYLLVVQQIESFIIDPKVVGKKLGLNPVFTLLAVSIGGEYFGIVGMVLAAPIVGVIKMYVVRMINKQYQIYQMSNEK